MIRYLRHACFAEHLHRTGERDGSYEIGCAGFVSLGRLSPMNAFGCHERSCATACKCRRTLREQL
jgi:hypothetical protein